MEDRDALCLLAVGGMAELHLVRISPPGEAERLAVVKRLQRQLAADPDYVRMFLDEARIASALHHPNVVEVYGVGDRPEAYYIAMEHLHGHDLRRTLARAMEQRAPLRLDQALSISRAVADGLHYTHECVNADGAPMDIVHRDVSPHNVIVTFDGAVKVVDFGIAKASTQASRTRTGVLKGKVAYMSPEQAAGRRVDRRSDVFSIGILLWEMTTGRWLYRRRTELETLNAVVHSRPPRPSRVVSRYPRDLEKIVMKALARAPGERWTTAGELRDAIDELARRRRLSLGTEPVQALMATLFGEEIAAWRDARSQGRSLGEHLAAQADTLVDPDEDDLLPAPALGSALMARLRQHRWLVVGGASAAAIAAAWLAVRLTAQAPDAAVAHPEVPAGAASAPAHPASPATPAISGAAGEPAGQAAFEHPATSGGPAGSAGAASPVNAVTPAHPAYPGPAIPALANPANPAGLVGPASPASPANPIGAANPAGLVGPASPVNPTSPASLAGPPIPANPAGLANPVGAARPSNAAGPPAAEAPPAASNDPSRAVTTAPAAAAGAPRPTPPRGVTPPRKPERAPALKVPPGAAAGSAAAIAPVPPPKPPPAQRPKPTIDELDRLP